jgi:hypothetical protein
VSTDAIETLGTPVGKALLAAYERCPMLPPQYCTTAELHCTSSLWRGSSVRTRQSSWMRKMSSPG